MPLQALEALTGGQPPSADDAQRHFMFATAQIHKQWRRVADRLLTPRGLTQALWLPLLHLHRADEPLRQKDLAFSLALDNSSVVRLVDGLMAQGWVETVADADRRVKRIQLTASGRAEAEMASEVLSEARQQVLNSVPAEDLLTAFATMQKLIQAMNALEEAAASDNLPGND
ncbi:MarR family winged helix-turn-helix transcriptional regulator [Comamonas sp. J-3]|uniref:MarR family winged helix-turn-helix transcriptional regulator n=1 Tax=Comamonas trifloxystrobinivorans TaxID=3350256 RepID=UPI00372BDA33